MQKNETSSIMVLNGAYRNGVRARPYTHPNSSTPPKPPPPLRSNTPRPPPCPQLHLQTHKRPAPVLGTISPLLSDLTSFVSKLSPASHSARLKGREKLMGWEIARQCVLLREGRFMREDDLWVFLSRLRGGWQFPDLNWRLAWRKDGTSERGSEPVCLSG